MHVIQSDLFIIFQDPECPFPLRLSLWREADAARGSLPSSSLPPMCFDCCAGEFSSYLDFFSAAAKCLLLEATAVPVRQSCGGAVPSAGSAETWAVHQEVALPEEEDEEGECWWCINIGVGQWLLVCRITIDLFHLQYSYSFWFILTS